MSKFLGPIHHWLFNKIKLYENLEKELIAIYKDKYGNDIDVLVNKMEESYGEPMGDQPLGDIIDTGNIHGWLQNRISIAEARQSAILTEIFNQYGSEAIDIALSTYTKQGAQSGADAKANGQTDSAPAIYKALNNYILDGMPCDNVNNISIAEPEHLQWKNTQCLHRGYWESVGANIEVFYQLRFAWIKAFVENSNENFIYQVEKTDLNGTTGFVHEILKK